MLKKGIFVLIVFLSLTPFIYSQVWTARYNGAANLDDCAVALAIDEQDNVYVTGYSYGLSNQKCYLTIKYNPNGETLWTRSYQGSGHSEAKGLVIDSEGNVYVTGWSDGISSSRDIYTVKYNPSGEALWSRRYNGYNNQDDEPTKVFIDSRDNIYITGYSFNTESNYDYVTIKYDKNGIERWVRSYNGPGDSTDKANSIAVDSERNVYVTGLSFGLGTKGDFATIKYDTLGNQMWVIRYDDSANIYNDYATGIGLDELNNVYVAGISDYDSMPGAGLLTFTIIKYNSSGEKDWIAESFPGAGSDTVSDMMVDHNGNVYITGTDVWWNVYRNYKTEMYDSTGQRIWAAYYDADSLHDFSNALAVDYLGYVYITGNSEMRQRRYDYATIKYDLDGEEQWVARYNGPGNEDDKAYAIALDRIGNVYVTGKSYGFGSGYDYCTIKYPSSGPGIYERKKIKGGKYDTQITRTIRRTLNPDIEVFTVQGRTVSQSDITSGVYFILKKDEKVKEKLVIIK